MSGRRASFAWVCAVMAFALSSQNMLGEVWFVNSWGGDGTGDGQFNAAMGIAVGPNGDVFVADHWGARVERFDPCGTFLGEFSEGLSQAVYGVATDANGRVYVVDHWGHNLRIYEPSGNLIDTWGGFEYPVGVAVGPSGKVYVTEHGVSAQRSCVNEFDSNGNLVRQWGGLGAGPGQFNAPYGVAVDSGGNVYVADTRNDRIQKFDPLGEYITQWGTPGSGAGQFDEPYSVAVNAQGDLYVTDFWNNRVQKFTSSGQYLEQWGSFGDGPGEFLHPTYIATSPAGDIYVAEYGVANPGQVGAGEDARVQRFSEIPEPATLSLLALSGLVMIRRRRK